MRDGLDAIETPRITVLAVFAMVMASVIALAVGWLGFQLWIPNVITFSNLIAQSANPTVEQGVYIFLSAGPLMAGGGLVLGWFSFLILRRPGAGWRLTLFLPMIWAVAVLAYMAVVSTVCEGRFACGL
ncbi:hypothetical protein F1654_00045 [Alkalicaulis satelles]|uniref:Uncharacterized protein n=1 Tax=Alkalicaulis satelles TaxID=2609175 RepID=A0A5M6ZJC7_9PROT|nr:hypothetical protein [Alkalicaulis satelles]KAA5804440.1 hypothetical protein F1654_00045 [Alkalicaulis satelles]